MATLRYNESDQMPDYPRSKFSTPDVRDISKTPYGSSFERPLNPFDLFGQAQRSSRSSSFSFNLNGGNDNQQLSLNGIPSSATANGVPVTTPTNGADNWRFKSFGPSLLDSKPASLTGPNSTFQTSPDAYHQVVSEPIAPGGLTPVSHAPGAYVTHPDAYHQTISNYQPKDMTKERQQYGWGGSE